MTTPSCGKRLLVFGSWYLAETALVAFNVLTSSLFEAMGNVSQLPPLIAA
jgi:hypothetical protein